MRAIGEFGHFYLVFDKINIDNNGKIWVAIEFLESGIKNHHLLNEILL